MRVAERLKRLAKVKFFLRGSIGAGRCYTQSMDAFFMKYLNCGLLKKKLLSHINPQGTFLGKAKSLKPNFPIY